MKVKLAEKQEEKEKDQENLGLSKESADKENIYAIELPISICEPFNADFDGDAMAVHLVPDDPDIQEETYARMSPRYVNIYKKNNEGIFHPNHETLNGLALASEVVPKKPEDLDDPKEFFTSYVDVLKAVEIDKTLDYQTPIVFTGKIGGENYKSKITTPGRLRISKIIDADLDKIKDEKGKLICPWPNRITAKSGANLYRWTYERPDNVEIMNALQKFGLHVVTVKGNVSFDFKTLYVDTKSETYDKIRKIVDDPTLTDKQKLLATDSLYKKYCKEVQSRFDEDLKDELNRAARVKIASIADINTPQFIISGVDEKVVLNHDSLYSGLSEQEYRYHSIF